MRTSAGNFDVVREGDTTIVTPVDNLGELDFEAIESGAREVLALVNSTQDRDVIVDFHRTDYFSSTALGLLVKLQNSIKGRGGRLVLCNVSAHERDILTAVRLAVEWPLSARRRRMATGAGARRSPRRRFWTRRSSSGWLPPAGPRSRCSPGTDRQPPW